MLSLMSGDLVASDDKLELVPASSSQVQGIVPLYAFSPDELVEFDKFRPADKDDAEWQREKDKHCVVKSLGQAAFSGNKPMVKFLLQGGDAADQFGVVTRSELLNKYSLYWAIAAVARSGNIDMASYMLNCLEAHRGSEQRGQVQEMVLNSLCADIKSQWVEFLLNCYSLTSGQMETVRFRSSMAMEKAYAENNPVMLESILNYMIAGQISPSNLDIQMFQKVLGGSGAIDHLFVSAIHKGLKFSPDDTGWLFKYASECGDSKMASFLLNRFDINNESDLEVIFDGFRRAVTKGELGPVKLICSEVLDGLTERKDCYLLAYNAISDSIVNSKLDVAEFLLLWAKEKLSLEDVHLGMLLGSVVQHEQIRLAALFLDKADGRLRPSLQWFGIVLVQGASAGRSEMVRFFLERGLSLGMLSKFRLREALGVATDAGHAYTAGIIVPYLPREDRPAQAGAGS